MPDHQCAVPVGQNLAQRADLADRLEIACLDDRQRLVEADGLALVGGRSHYVSEPPNPAVVILGWIRRLAPIFRSDWPLDGVENR